MNSTFFYFAERIDAVAFFVAFVLTVWPSRARLIVASSLYVVGMFFIMGLFTYSTFNIARMLIGLSDSGSSNPIALIAYVIPITGGVYAITASALLLPAIPQKRAMRLGMILHLIVLPILVALLSVHGAPPVLRSVYPTDLKWLAFGLLWFRIRESYERPPNKTLQVLHAGHMPQ
jgi:hypothetical protein